MEHIEFEREQLISFKAKENSTPKQALTEAIDFCFTNNIEECELWYCNYLFDIEAGYNAVEKAKEYHEACIINKEWIKE